MLAAATTGGWIVGLVALAVCVIIGIIIVGLGLVLRSDGGGVWIGWVLGGIVWLLVSIGVWWWASAFTTSSEYHAWNVKQGVVSQVSNRLVPVGDKGAMMQRYVVKFADGSGPYGIDDTRASLIKVGQHIRIECKRDYQFGQPREVNGWACRWREAVR